MMNPLADGSGGAGGEEVGGDGTGVGVGGVGETVHDAFWYEPESVPFVQVRAWETHEEPDGTVAL